MKAKLIGLIGLVLVLAGIGLVAFLNWPRPGGVEARTYSSFDPPDSRSAREVLTNMTFNFVDAEPSALFDVYQQLSGRTVIRPETLPRAKINLRRDTPLTRRTALQMLDTALAENNITMVLMGTQFVKAVPSGQAPSEAGPVVELPAEQLPDSGSYMIRIVRLKRVDPSETLMAIQPFSKLPNSIIAIKSAHLLILRDYSANIRRMLPVIDELEKGKSALGSFLDQKLSGPQPARMDQKLSNPQPSRRP